MTSQPLKRKPITVDDLWLMSRLGAIVASPDGTRAACTVTRSSMEENKSSTQLWMLFADGRAPQQITHSGERNAQPAWSPVRKDKASNSVAGNPSGNGDSIAFIAKREQEGGKDSTAQLFLLPADGGEARRISHFAPGIEAFKWMPGGKQIVFVAWVWPHLRGAAAQAKKYREFAARKESGYATSEAHWRYFDHNLPQDRVLHLLTLDVSTGKITDLFEGTAHELPRDEPSNAVFDISPDGQRIVFACDTQTPKLSSHRLSLLELTLATRQFKNISDVKAWQQWDFNAPRYSPDGRTLAAIAAHNHQQHTVLAQLLLRGPDGQWQAMGHNRDHEVNAPLRWSADGSCIYLTAEEHGRCHLWRYELASKKWPVQFKGGWVQGFDVGGSAGNEHIFTLADGASHPVRAYVQQGAGAALRLDNFNDDILQRCEFGAVQEQHITGAQGDKVQMWITYPPGFTPRKKHPVMHVIHGGPYAASGETFSYRWNSHVLASQGHVVVQVNYHGSSSFGFQFRHSIMGQLGQLETLDIEAATDWLLQQRWVDKKRIVATGGSYGGYLVAWMNGHVAPGRYQAYVCHAGVFDRVATWAADSYTHRHKDLGANYWDDLKKVLAQSPHAFANKMQTPTLVIHGAQDFRVPDTNGLAYYNTLQARGVDTRLLWFPDENHWVLKPRNSKQWYGEFLAWVSRYTAPRSAVHPGVAA